MASMGKEANGSLLAVDAPLSCIHTYAVVAAGSCGRQPAAAAPLVLLLPLTWDGSCDALLLVAVPSVSSPLRSCPNSLDEVHG